MAKKKPDSAPEQEGEVKEKIAEVEQPATEEAEKPAETEDAAAKALKELEEENDKYLRLAAEYDNFRKRSSRERETIYSEVRADTITKLLPVYDNLERALRQETQDEAYRKGVELTMTQLEEILKSMGVTEIEAEGLQFDPALHNAVMHVDDESVGEGIIVEQFQKGFKLGEKVLRFSMVKVAN